MRLIKSIYQVLAIAALLLSTAGLTSCTTHLCGVSTAKPHLADFEPMAFDGPTHVYPLVVTPKPGSPLLLMHGLGGLDETTIEFAKDLENHGWKVYMPLLDSEFNMCDVVEHEHRIQKSGLWNTDDPKASGQVLTDMGHLADWICKQHSGKRVTVVGSCMTGGFPLGLLGRTSVRAAVLCQPALPLKNLGEIFLRIPQSKERRLGLGLSDADIQSAIKALQTDRSKGLYGFHYLDDPLAYFDKFIRLHEALEHAHLGSRFHPVVLVPKGKTLDYTWCEVITTTVKDTAITPHVTLTGAEAPDRAHLRDRFHQLIRP